jgi:DNA polymerase III subunit beta
MDLTVPRRDLLTLVKRAQPVANAKSTMPVLANVLLDVDATSLRVAAFDLYLSVDGRCPADVRRQGSVAVNAKDFLERVNAMPDGPLLLKCDGSSLTLKAAGSARKYTLHTVAGEEFPKLPQPDAEAPRFALPGAALRGLIAHVVFAISPDDTRPNLNSALLEIRDGTIRLVSTDGHRLAKVESKIESADAVMLLPLKAILTLRKIAEDTDGDVSVTASEPVAFFEADGITFGVKLVEAQFPSYEKVIPKSSSKIARVPRVAFAEALKAVGLAANDKTGGIKLTLAPGILRITSESPDSGDGLDEVAMDYDGAEMTIGFKASYIQDVLGALGCEEVVLGCGGELDPMILRPGTEGDEYEAVVMPMRI